MVCAIRYLDFLFQTAPAGIIAEPQQITVLIGHLSGDADLVTVEVAGLLSTFAVFVGGVSIGEAAYVRTAHVLSQDRRFRTDYGLL